MMTTSRSLSCAETATHLRRALAAAFPGVKFSVRSKTYSGGASISVRWTDGPATPKVEAVARQFEGASFDGMIDLKSYHASDLALPDGTVQRVHHGADYVFCYRDISDEAAKTAAALALCRTKLGGIETVGGAERWGDRWLTDLASQVARGRDGGESLEHAFNRIILRQEG